MMAMVVMIEVTDRRKRSVIFFLGLRPLTRARYARRLSSRLSALHAIIITICLTEPSLPSLASYLPVVSKYSLTVMPAEEAMY